MDDQFDDFPPYIREEDLGLFIEQLSEEDNAEREEEQPPYNPDDDDLDFVLGRPGEED